MIFFELLPGIGLSFVVAFSAMFFAALLPFDFISATVLAIFIGVIINNVVSLPEALKPGIQFSAKRLLKGFIILLGASMNFSLIFDIGGPTLLLLVFTISTAFLSSFFVGKMMNTPNRLKTLFAVGGAICGGSAITAISPVIKAEEKEIAYSVSTVFLVDMVLILVIPILARMLNLSDLAMGLWSGTAINDTSSVVAASFSFSQAAGEFATMVKMTRTLAIIPVVLFFSVRNHSGVTSRKIKSIFPWFIAGFAALALINTLGWIPSEVNDWLSIIRQYLMVMALGAIGLKTNLQSIKLLGLKPFIHSLIVSICLIIVSLLVISIII